MRIPTDAQSDQLNRSVQAKAFTAGQDIFFREGAYEPGSRPGQELIAHELTHVIQQNSSTLDAVIQRQTMEFHDDYKEKFRPQKDNQDFELPSPTPKKNWQKLDVKIFPSDNFKTNHLRDTVNEDTARAALRARPGDIRENTIFQRNQMITAAAALKKPYYVSKAQIGYDVVVRVKNITAKLADRRLNPAITVLDLQTFSSAGIKILGRLSEDGTITLIHIDQRAG